MLIISYYMNEGKNIFKSSSTVNESGSLVTFMKTIKVHNFIQNYFIP